MVFTVERGESAATIGQHLENVSLIRSALLFRALTAYYGASTSLEAGQYELSPSMTITQIISRLHRGLVRQVTVPIPEGWRAEQIADALAEAGAFSREDFMKAYREGTFDYEFLNERPRGATLEGYLFPATYELGPDASPEGVIRRMLQAFDEWVTPAMRQQATARGLTLHQVITLASIVEREAVLPEEQAIIASVFLNRRERGMPIAADPTVQYALAEDPQNVARYGYWKKELTLEDLAVDSPYNTYRNPGLPPGPISNPGLAAIEAALNPEATEYLYFVARGDGSHVFSKTFEKHLQNVARYGRP